jgi:uncharacterized cupredoxin-like copper-binding protein
MVKLRMGFVVLATAVAGFAWSVPALAAPSAAKVTTVNVIAGKPTEFKYRFSRTSAPKGVVVFKVKNAGMIVHDLKINGKKTRLLKGGQSQAIRVVFKKPGRYNYVCTVAGHAAAGMKGVFVVK